ncbi:MAG: ribose-phosphate pyrophosphokinase-like domain-containing protein, partial [Thermoanaerobacterales bacterium]|nr:ribose-phosphate pyrophosphokinase-like domain-containing protein [Thermoanaerobacterales bacterium]
MNKLKIFTGNANVELARDIAHHLDIEIGDAVVNTFSDGEIQVKIDESVRGADVFVVQPLSYPVNQNIMEL